MVKTTGALLEEAGYKVVAVMLFGSQEFGRFPTREQAEWRAQELNEWSERNPRGYVQYLVRPVAETRGSGGSGAGRARGFLEKLLGDKPGLTRGASKEG